MNKNLNAVKTHNEIREKFISSIQKYNWESDALKLKPIRDAAAQLPACNYIEPNFVQIKNALNRSNDLTQILVKNQ